MKITVQGIGAIKYASINCESIAVITGKNGSGKSTFGKALYSLSAGIQNSSRFYDFNFVRHAQVKLCSTLGIPYQQQGFSTANARHDESVDHLIQLLQKPPYVTVKAAQFFDKLTKAVDALDTSALGDLSRNSIPAIGLRLVEDGIKEDLIADLLQLRKEYGSNDYRLEQLQRCLKDQFNEVFIGQVTPSDRKGVDSIVSIESDASAWSYSYTESVFKSSQFPSINPLETYFIQDGNILDSLDNRGNRAAASRRSSKETMTTPVSGELCDFIRKQSSLFASKDDFPGIFEIIDRVYPYDIYISNGKTFTSNNGISISNEASGRKIFALLKYMLIGGAINKRSILIFDEPENHLHPEWQLLFAKLIKRISEATGAKIICITHSPTMLFALDVLYAKSRKGLSVYHAHFENQESIFEDCTQDISKAHKAISDPYIKLDLLGEAAI